MASQEQYAILQKFLFKEREAKLFVFKKNRENPTTIKEHLIAVKEFVKLFDNSGITESERTAIFLKYFDEDLLTEIRCDPKFDESKQTMESYEEFLINLCEVKKSKISFTMTIFETRQEKGESILDFAKRLRIQCHSIKEMKEEIMVKAFLNGLFNRRIAVVLELFKPKTLDEAVEAIKDEKHHDEEENLVFNMRYEKDTIKALKMEIEKLRREIAELKANVNPTRTYQNKKTNYESKPLHNQWKTFTRKEGKINRKCYECGKEGHLARFCRAKRCFQCGQGGHIARICPENNKLRFYSENDEAASEYNLSSSIEPEDNEETQSDSNMVNEKKWSKEKSKEIIKSLKPSIEEKYVNFINGQGAKPKQILKKYEPTVISYSRPEKARNKPIVECQVAGLTIKTMFDTGADLNVISHELAERIRKQNPAVKIYNSSTKVTCANGTTENCLGKMQLNVAIGPVVTAHVFDIMPNIFPHLFIGLRSMKKYEVLVDTANDGIEIQGIKIPFLSKTIAAESIKN